MPSPQAQKPILIIGAHPDDETLGCGGTIAQLVHEGRDVTVAVLTSGENLLSVLLNITDDPAPHQVGEIRRRETQRAVRILGVKNDVRFLGFEDGKLQSQRDAAVDHVAALLRELDPAEVYCTNAFEEHPDHRAAEQIVRDACARVASPIAIWPYFVILRKGMSLADVPRPLRQVDITPFLPLKREALNVFRSHLDVLSTKQQKPLAADFDGFLQPAEHFIRDV